MINKIDTVLNVNNQEVRVIYLDGRDYISLTDIAKHSDSLDLSFTIKNWLRKTDTINYIGLWEELNNNDFNLVEFDQIKKEYGVNTFSMSPSQWIKRTNSIGFISKGGRYSQGTFAVSDIAFEFASWLSPEFKLYLITEFQRLKKNEAYQNKIEWHANRVLSKTNYLVHTEAIKNYIVPTLTDKQIRTVYAEEADILNVALFGMTAKDWRISNPELSKDGNIRDYTDLIHLVILNNLENINAEYIKQGLSQSDRLVILNEIARNQMELFINNKNILELEKTRVI
ncbi:MAG: KilA-N domain-containing protein [Bacilli bacterium]|nr:KilA-N domain-containing protein [Bacilli bacterium]